MVGILAFIIGFIQILIDIGWIGIIKINRELNTWSEAYSIVVKQRSQKFFLFPVYIDILFIGISLGTVAMLNL